MCIGLVRIPSKADRKIIYFSFLSSTLDETKVRKIDKSEFFKIKPYKNTKLFLASMEEAKLIFQGKLFFDGKKCINFHFFIFLTS